MSWKTTLFGVGIALVKTARLMVPEWAPVFDAVEAALLAGLGIVAADAVVRR